MTSFANNRERAHIRFLDLIVGTTVVVLLFNLAVLLAIHLMEATAPSRVALSELTLRDPITITVIEKTEPASTPKQNLEPFPAPATIDRS